MATGYEKGGVDLDTLFLPLEGTKAANTGYKVVGGNDLSDLFEPIGDGTKIADVGYQDGGVDLSNIFRDINEPIIEIGGDWPESGDVIAFNESGGSVTAGFWSFQTDGQYRKYFGPGSNAFYDFLTAIGTNYANDFYIKRSTYTGTLTTNIPTSYTAITQSYWAYNTQTGNGTKEASGLTIYIAEDDIGTGEVSWTGKISAQVTTT